MNDKVNENDQQPDICDLFYDELLKERPLGNNDKLRAFYGIGGQSELQKQLEHARGLLEGDEESSSVWRQSLIAIGKLADDDDVLQTLGSQIFDTVYPALQHEATKRIIQNLLGIDDQAIDDIFDQPDSCDENERKRDKETRLERLRNLTTNELLGEGKKTLWGIHSIKVHESGDCVHQEASNDLSEIEFVLGERLLSDDVKGSLGAQFLRAFHACEIEEQAVEMQLIKAGDHEELERLGRDYF